jgi:hypothetical protein
MPQKYLSCFSLQRTPILGTFASLTKNKISQFAISSQNGYLRIVNNEATKRFRAAKRRPKADNISRAGRFTGSHGQKMGGYIHKIMLFRDEGNGGPSRQGF